MQTKRIEVGVFDNTTDCGRIGTYKTVRGAIREGRKWARCHSGQTGYAGYGPTIRMREVDPDGTKSDSWDVAAW